MRRLVLVKMADAQKLRNSAWFDQVMGDTEDDMKTWSEKCRSEADAANAAHIRIEHHCSILKLSEKLLEAYRNGDDELKTKLRTI